MKGKHEKYIVLFFFGVVAIAGIVIYNNNKINSFSNSLTVNAQANNKAVEQQVNNGWEDCENYKDIEIFKKPKQIVWLAKMNGCLESCQGGSFTSIEAGVEYPRFAAYLPDGEKIPEEYKDKNDLVLKIVGEWIGIGDDYYNTVFSGQCVPIITIKSVTPAANI